MSNTINFAHQRRRLTKTFKSSGEPSVNDCRRPPLGSSKADLVELHREKMRSLRAWRKQGGSRRIRYSPYPVKPSRSDDPAWRNRGRGL